MSPSVVVIGSNGQLGTDITKIFNNNRFDTIPLTHQQIEVSNYESIEKALGHLSFDIIINTSAYHRVDEIEKNPKLAFEINSLGALNLAKYSNTRKAMIVFISTDYIFGQDSKKATPYTETDKPGPLNVYGISKLTGEFITSTINNKNLIIRTSGLFGTAGSSGKKGNFVETIIKKAEKNEELKIVTDQKLSPTYTLNLAQQILILIQNNQTGTFNAVSNGSCSWWEFANELCKQTNLKVRPIKTTSKDWITPAKRPSYSVLSNQKLKSLKLCVMNSWQENLRLYLQEKGHI